MKIVKKIVEIVKNSYEMINIIKNRQKSKLVKKDEVDGKYTVLNIEKSKNTYTNSQIATNYNILS